jgi:hypothetical protein
MSETKLTGRCFCGAVSFRATSAPEVVETCYCSDCTRAVGSVITAWARFPSTDFEFCGDAPVEFSASPGITRSFCGRCGTSLTYHRASGQEIDVSTATLDMPARFPPTSDGPGRPSWLPPQEREPKA